MLPVEEIIKKARLFRSQLDAAQRRDGHLHPDPQTAEFYPADYNPHRPKTGLLRKDFDMALLIVRLEELEATGLPVDEVDQELIEYMQNDHTYRQAAWEGEQVRMHHYA